jgi:hypothetical protein
MKKNLYLSLLIILCLINGLLKSQTALSGTYNVPSTFTSIGAAINALNTFGVSGPVTINVLAGNTETATSGGYTLTNVAGSSSVNTITFQKSGSGANPLITAFTGTATPSNVTQDGIWRFIGCDFVTINGIDLFDPNTTVPASMEFGYGFFKSSATDGCQNNTIQNCVITLNRVNNAPGSGPALEGSKGIEMVNATSSAHTTNLTITSASGANSNNKFYSNTIQNCNLGISISGFSTVSPFTFADFNNDIGGSSISTGNTIINFGGGGANASNAIATLAQYNFNASFNTINNNNGSGVSHAGILRGIFVNAATSANVSVNNNTITMIGGGTTQNVVGIQNASGSTAANNSINLNNNQIVNCTYTTATTGVFNAILNSATPSTVSMNGNIMNNHNLGGTGLHVLMALGSPSIASMNSNSVTNIFRNGLSGTLRLITWTSPQVITVNSNIVNSISWTAATSTGATDCLYGLSGALAVTANNNQIYNISVPTTGVINGIREFGSSLGVKTFTGNQIYNFGITAGGVGGATMNGIFCSTGTVNILSNSIYSLQSIGSTGGTGGSIYGVQLAGGVLANISKNKVHDLTSNASAPTVGGILIAGSNCLVSNNLIGSLTTPSANAVNALLGMNVTAGTSHTIAYNTVNLNGVSSGANFGSSAFNLASTTATILVRNNIFVNTSTPNGTGLTVAFRKSSSVFTNYANASDNNLFWAGTPSANQLIHSDGTTSYQTLASYKTLASPRDAASVTENPPFISLVGSTLNFLNLNTITPTQVQSGGAPLSFITDDYAGALRNATFPDIGAWEGNFTPSPLDAIAPSLLSSGFISNQCNTSSRTFTANLIDVSGLGSATASPRVYYRIGAGTYSSVAGVLSAGTASAGVWTFTLTYGAVLNDVISHYLVVQDIASTPNLVAFPSSGFAGTDVNTITTPPATPNTYTIAGSLAGTYTVGASGTYTSLTAAAFAYNNSCLTSSVTFVLADATYSNEVLPITFSNNVDASSTNSLLIRPATAVAVSINGTNTAAPAMIKLHNARFISVDGLNSGGSSLTINNISTASSANIWLASASGIGTKFISIRNTALNGGNITSNNGIISCIDGASPSATGGADNDNVIIQGNTFQTLFNGILAVGSAATSNGGLDNWAVSNNIIGPATGPGTNVIGGSGVVFANALGIAVTSNTIRNIYTTSSAVYGININSSVNGFTVAQNTVSNLVSGASSSGVSSIAGLFMGSNAINGQVLANQLSTITNTSTGGWGARGLILNTGNAASNITIRNNFIAGISCYADASAIYSPVGIDIANLTGSVNVEYNSVSLSGSFAGLTTGSSISAPLYITSANGNLNIRNNIFSNTYDNTTSTLDVCYAIYSAVPNTNFLNINNNSYFASSGGTAVNVLAFLGGNQTNLAGIQTAFGQNLNSVNLLPVFTSATDLHINAASASNFLFDNLGSPISGVTTDIDAQARNSTTPDIGADEFTGTAVCSSANGGSISISSFTQCSNQVLALASLSVSAGLGTAYQWQVSPTSGGTYTNVSSGSGTNTPSFSTPTLAAGIYYYVLRATCGASTAISNEATVTINAAPNPVIVASNSVFCNGGNSTTLTASGAASYLWNTGATTNSIVITPTSSAAYNVVGSNTACANVTSASNVVFFSLSPTVTAAAINTLLCSGTPATLTASGANTYSWDYGATGSTVSPSPSITTIYTVTGAFTNGCTNIATVSMSVNASPTINITGSSGICTGQTATLIANGALTYTWNTGSNSATITSNPSSNTTYTVTGTDANACSTTTTQLVSVAASLSISITGPSAICTGSTTILTGNGGVTYLWNTGATTPTISVNPTVTTTYSIIGSSGTCSNTASRNLTVNPNPTVTLLGNLTICSGQSTTLTAGGASTYTWNTGSNLSSIVVSPTVNTSYTVSGTSPLGCVSSSVSSVVSNSLPVISVLQSSAAICAFTSATLTASGANTYTWNTGAINASIAITPSVTTAFSVTGTNGFGCIRTATTSITAFPLPLITITPPAATVCVASPVTFSADGASTYTWNGSVANVSVTLNPTVSTTYSVIGTNSLGCVNSTTVGVLTNSLPIITIAPASTTLCSLSIASFTASGASTYTWNNTVQGANFNNAPSSNTTYTVVGTNALGCNSSNTVAAITLSLPVIAITPSIATVCAGTTSTFAASGAQSYTWSNASNSSTIALTPTISTGYVVNGTGSNGCVASTPLVILTNPLPNLVISPASSTICPSTPIGLNVTGANSYSWSNGGNGTSTTVTPVVSSVYSVTGTDANGCIGSGTASVVTKVAPVISIAPASASVCLFASANFSATGAVTFTWSTGALLDNISVSPTVSTTYSVSGSNTLGCVSTSTVNLIVWQPPVVNVSASSQTVCARESITLTASGAATYTWFPFNATGSSFTTNPVNTTTYIVSGNDANGCNSSTNIVVFVDKCVGIEQNTFAADAVNVYPNPSNGIITADMSFEGKKTIVVTNAVGAKIYEFSSENEKEMINLQEFAKGIYFVKINAGDRSGNYRIIIQ